jgi:Peptidase family M48
MKKITMLMLGALVVFSTALPMQRTAFSRFCKVVNVGVASGGLVKVGYESYNADNELSVLEDADEEVASFINRHLKKNIGLKNIEKVRIKKGDPSKGPGLNMARAGHTMLVVPQEGHRVLVDFVRNTIKEEEEYLVPLILAVDEHEVGHINNQDLKNAAIACVAIPLAMHPVGRLFAKNVCKFNPPKSNMRMLGRAVGGGYIRSVVGWQIFCAYSRYFEQRADDGVNDVKMSKVVLEEIYKKMPEVLRQFPLLLDPLHPPLRDRIEKLKMRIQAQEAAEANNAEENSEKE